MNSKRTDLQRFQVGDRVKVTGTIGTRYCNRLGTILSVKVSRYARTLDKYRIVFDDKSQEDLWDIQLEPAESTVWNSLQKTHF